jgi:hypothetical protein
MSDHVVSLESNVGLSNRDSQRDGGEESDDCSNGLHVARCG